MKYISAFILVFSIIVLTSCDGKERAYKTNQEVLQEHQQLEDFSTKTTYFPAEYTEKVTDTILANTMRITIKHFSDDSTFVSQTLQLNDSTKAVNNYRDLNAEITVSYNNKTVLNKTYKKPFFAKNDRTNRKFINEEAVLRVVEVNQLDSINTKFATIDFVFCKPETDDCLVYKLKVNPEGKYVIELSEDIYYKEE